ncbi:hypothetical protein E2C01_086943 [Portunus trituberculatus]|uniref:Uncharacterized protein n=1 Tax=Portunus trituberculatus TaxID=210409 RepID=A0A5B7J255_PORTR|nr:hypothetical protein [Portunus trituberculatus]
MTPHTPHHHKGAATHKTTPQSASLAPRTSHLTPHT